MTHTTTDAAEARALPEHQCWSRGLGRLSHRHWFYRDQLQPTCERCSTPIDREHKEVGPVAWEPPVKPPFATAEAASGAGGQIAAELTAYRRDQADDEYITVAGSLVDDAIAALASLPPATDPAMGLDPVTIERCAKVADRMATSTTVPEEANNAAWNLAIAIRALAAAPTIPATGEAGQ